MRVHSQGSPRTVTYSLDDSDSAREVNVKETTEDGELLTTVIKQGGELLLPLLPLLICATSMAPKAAADTVTPRSHTFTTYVGSAAATRRRAHTTHRSTSGHGSVRTKAEVAARPGCGTKKTAHGTRTQPKATSCNLATQRGRGPQLPPGIAAQEAQLCAQHGHSTGGACRLHCLSDLAIGRTKEAAHFLFVSCLLGRVFVSGLRGTSQPLAHGSVLCVPPCSSVLLCVALCCSVLLCVVRCAHLLRSNIPWTVTSRCLGTSRNKSTSPVRTTPAQQLQSQPISAVTLDTLSSKAELQHSTQRCDETVERTR